MRITESGVILQLLESGLAAAVIRSGCFSVAAGILPGAGKDAGDAVSAGNDGNHCSGLPGAVPFIVKVLASGLWLLS
ncbi:MAG: hypothetical protein H6R25_86 [Proteobacteria bacterium]|nr:hypothetical protein [Pseudomonadota bacterium]